MTGEMTEGLPFTKEDFRDLRDTIAAVKGLEEKITLGFKNTNEKIDALAVCIDSKQDDCAGFRKRYDSRLVTVEKAQDAVKEQHTEERGFLKGRKADAALVISIIGLVAILIGIWRNLKI